MKKLIPALVTCSVLAMAASIGPEARPVSLPEGHEFTNPDRQVFSISPDGTRVAYVAKASIFIEPLGGGEPINVPGPLAGRPISSPVFSPDGQSILYWTVDGALLKRVPASGGTPVTICNADQPFGMSWGADGQILFGQGVKGIMRVSARGGMPETIVQARSGEILHGPRMLPGGESVLFTVGDEHTDVKVRWEQSHIVVQDLKSGERKTVVPAGRDARYLPGGYLAYVLGGRVMAVRFDAAKLTTSGQPVPVVDNVRTARATGTAQFDVSPNGTLAYLSGQAVPLQLGLVSLDGTRKMLGPVPEDTSAPRVSADGLKVTYAADGDIYVADLANLAGARKVITAGTFPLFSPDGQWLAFGSLGTKRDGGVEEIFVQRSDGSGQAELVAKPARAPEHWLNNEEFSFISHRGGAENYDIWTYNLKEKGLTPVAVIPQSAQLSSRFSPDHKWVTYMSSESGDWQVYLQPWPETGVKYQVTKQRGRLPMWSADGRAIYYDWDGKMFAVPVNFGSDVTFGPSSPLPVTGYIQPLIRRNYDMTSDLKQFVMLFRAAPRVEVISNLFDDLKKRLPTP
jgi:Tol biopolymer transport system component